MMPLEKNYIVKNTIINAIGIIHGVFLIDIKIFTFFSNEWTIKDLGL